MNNSLWMEHLKQWETFLSERLKSLQLQDDRGELIKTERQLQIIFNIHYAAVRNPKLISTFIDYHEDSCIENSQELDYFMDDALNDSQKLAVERALMGQTLTLIQGPPGTGKTQVIAEICLQLFKNYPGIKILLCSETHTAVNHMIKRITKHNNSLRIVRIRDKEKDPNDTIDVFSPKSIIDLYLSWLNQYCSDQDICDIIANSLSDTDELSLEKALMLSSNISGTTCNRAGAYNMCDFNEVFDVAIIDEACKATLPEILMPLSISKKAVIVGDPKQLPPVFCSAEREIINSIEKCELLRYFYIDDLFIKSKSTVFLDTQYRMTNQIGRMISEIFYKEQGGIKNGFDRDDEESIIWVDYNPTQDWPTAQYDKSISNQLFNLDECRIIHYCLEMLRTNKEYKKIGIITPYKKQESIIRESINTVDFPGVSVSTIDKCQGKEYDVVIFSLTRTRGTQQFLADNRRLNVALSRAMKKLIICGNKGYALRDPTLKMVLSYASIKTAIVSTEQICSNFQL